MAFVYTIITLAIIAFVSSYTNAYDPSPLQDFCVASNDPKSTVFVNGRVCKDPKLVTADDFFTSGLNVSGPLLGGGVALNPASIDRVPGLNTLGLLASRVDIEAGALAPPHTHPRGSEMVFVLQGTFDVGFITPDPSNPLKNRLYAKTLNAGDVFVIPQGVLHYQANVGKVSGTSINILNSQNPGTVLVANEMFGSDSALSDDVLSKTFRVDQKTIKLIKSKFASK